jgi:hypothetical protein
MTNLDESVTRPSDAAPPPKFPQPRRNCRAAQDFACDGRGFPLRLGFAAMSFVERPLGGDAPPREVPPAPPAAPVVDLDPHALPSWRKSKGGPGLLRAAPVTCAIAGVALTLGLAVIGLVGAWSDFFNMGAGATSVAFGGDHAAALRKGDWERLFLAPLLAPFPFVTAALPVMFVALAVPIERRLGAWRFGVLVGTAAPLAVAATLIGDRPMFSDRDPIAGLTGLCCVMYGATLGTGQLFPGRGKPSPLTQFMNAFWLLVVGTPPAAFIAGLSVGWGLGRAFVKADGPPGRSVRFAATALLVAWLAAAASTTVGLADRLAVAVPLDRVERLLSPYVSEGKNSYVRSELTYGFLRSGVGDRLDEAVAGARSEEERRLTTLLQRAAQFDDEADAKRKALRNFPGGTWPSREDAEAEREESRTRWRAFYGACRANWDRLRLRR